MSIGRKIALGFASSLAILAVVGAIDYRTTRELVRLGPAGPADASGRSRRSTPSAPALEEARDRQLIHLLSGKPDALEAFRASRPGVDAALADLRGLTVDDPEPGAEGRGAGRPGRRVVRLGGPRRAAARGRGRVAVVRLIGRAQDGLTAARKAIEEIRAAEQSRLADRDAVEAETADLAIRVVVCGMTAAALTTS